MKFNKFYLAALMFADEDQFDLTFEVAQSLSTDLVSVGVHVSIEGIGCDEMHRYYFSNYRDFKIWHKDPLTLVEFAKRLNDYINRKLAEEREFRAAQAAKADEDLELERQYQAVKEKAEAEGPEKETETA